MKDIRNVLICGIGAVGSIYAKKIKEFSPENLRVLVDEKRRNSYINNPIIFNGERLVFTYVLPEETDFKPDLIIIATKFDGLDDAVKNIKNFVTPNTIIISLLNGINSEEIIAKTYGGEKILLSYFIGHSAMRDGRIITQDGVGDIVFGSKNSDKENENRLKEFFERANISYNIPKDIEYALWLKYMFNVSTNQLSAILNMTFGEMRNNKKFMELSGKLMREVQLVAKAEGVKNTENMIEEALCAFANMVANGKTSMLQDIQAKRKTEVNIFAGTMIEFGRKHSVSTPYNELMKEMIEIIEQNY